MLPPCPPSPPEGPPRGTYFSRRKAMQPLPPSPAFANILASSTNTGIKLRKSRPAAQWHHRPKARGKKNAVRPSRTSETKRGGQILAKCNHRIHLVRGGLGLLRRLDADEAAVTSLVLKLHEARNHGVERVVLALADVFSGLVLGAALAHQDGAGVHELPAEALDAQPLAVRIAAVCRGAAAFLMCHDLILFNKKRRVEARRNVESYSLISLTCTAV